MTDQRLHKLHGPLGDDALFRRLHGTDELGRPFFFEVEVLHPSDDFAPDDIIGRSLSVEVLAEGKSSRFFHGFISKFLNVGRSGGYSLYQMELRPWIWFLSRSLDSRIYQNLTVPQIIEKVFRDKNGFSDFQLKLQNTYASQEYCVQYGESDFDFVSRLMEQEGIYYYFEHLEAKHTLVLVDTNSTHPAIEGNGELLFRTPDVASGDELIVEWQHQVSIQPGKLVLRDFDYNKPNANLEVRANATRSHPHSNIEQYEYPGSYSSTSDGDRYLKLRREEFDAQFSKIEGFARSHSLATGKTFTLAEHSRNSENGAYLVISMTIEVSSGEVERFTSGAENRRQMRFIAIPKAESFRPERTSPVPVMKGPQTAIVVGKEGEEIWTDSMGRVKVQFHWDRLGTKNEQSSCWIRVSQIWSGKGWGSMHIPRIGQEVIVDFVDGDPNQPIVVGRVYNADQTVPYELPANQSQSGLKSRSTPSGDAATFNELRFDDKKGEESIYFHAEKNFERIVENNDTLKVGFEKKDNGDQTIDVFGNQTVKVGTSESDGSQTLEVWKDQTETIKTGNRAITIEKGNDSLTVSAGDHKIDISQGKCEVTAAQKIVLTVGSSSITITPDKIEISSTKIEITATGQASVSGATTEVKASGNLTIQGSLVKIN